MRKSFLVTSILGSTLLASIVAISGAFGEVKSLFRTIANRGVDHTLYLDSRNYISGENAQYEGEISATVYTANGNQVNFSSSNVITNNSGWQTILPGGYFYNPLQNSANFNKITGISSVKFNSSGSNNLSLCYGYSIDNEDIIYSYEKELHPNETYDFGGLNPSYLYIKNNNSSSVGINDFIINYSCVETEYPKQDLNILMIGNSFADDTIFYASRVAASYGINLNIYDAYIGGCTLDTHYSNLLSNDPAYSMRSVNGNTWNYQDNMSLTSIINSNTWDIITFQQASGSVGRHESYSNLSNLVSGVRSLVGQTPRFYWYQTWAYDSDYRDYYDYFAYFNNDQTAMFNAICNCYTTEVEPLNLFDDLISGGTAVQNLRTSYMKDMFTRDGKHMSGTQGRLLLGLNFVSQVYDIDFSKSPCSFLPGEVNESFKTVAYESIKNARKSPLFCTNSLYTDIDLSNYNLANYTEIDAELLGCSFWNSTDTNNYNKRIANTSGTSNKFVTTKRFTSSTLPVGSIVVIGEPFGVRPEAWKTDAVQSNRPSEIYDNVIEITSSFWSGYQYRAFNIFKSGHPTLSGTDVGEQYDDIFDTFHIYVPNSAMGSLSPKNANPCYSADKVLFENNILDIDSYDRVHLDPITGFYKCDSYYYLMNSYVDSTAQKFVCTRPFNTVDNDLPANTVLITDSGYQWRSDCWGSYGTYSPRPDNISENFYKLDSSFMNNFRTRTFNVSLTNGSLLGQTHLETMNHFRIYVPKNDNPRLKVLDGTYNGIAKVNGNNFSLVLSFGKQSSQIGARISNVDCEATSYSYNTSTKKVTINTNGSYLTMSFGLLTGTYDEANDRITGISCSGSIRDYVNNNGSIILNKVSTSSSSFYCDCDGATDQLRLMFKRRYNNGSWNVDTSNADRIVSNKSQVVSGGGAMQRKGWTGGAVALNLLNDFSTGKLLENIQFWVYNPSSSDITLRMWVYTAPGLNKDQSAETGSVTAKANKWTYLAMGFTKTTIYNFQIADFTNSGQALVFDNIYLYSI